MELTFKAMVFYHNLPCIVLIVAILSILLISKFAKNISSIFKILALVIFLIQVVWQFCIGSTFQEMILIWLVEAIVFIFTMNPSKKEKNNEQIQDKEKNNQ